MTKRKDGCKYELSRPRGVWFHVLINSHIITGKLILQPLSSFNEANYDRHKCKRLIVVYTGAHALTLCTIQYTSLLRYTYTRFDCHKRRTSAVPRGHFFSLFFPFVIPGESIEYSEKTRHLRDSDFAACTINGTVRCTVILFDFSKTRGSNLFSDSRSITL